MSRLGLIVCLVGAGLVALAVSAPAPAHAEDAEDAEGATEVDPGARVKARLARGRALYEEQEYRKAVRELAQVARDPAATTSQKLQALELLGVAWLILGDEAKAREAFEDLLAIDAGYQLKEASGSPKIAEFYAAVRREFVPDAAPGTAALEHSAPPSATAGARLEVAAQVIAGADVVKEIVVRWRRRGELSYRDVPMRAARAGFKARFALPASGTAYILDYYLEARDLGGRVVARVAGPETPLSLRVRAGRPAVAATPWYGRWYVWAGAGAVVLGAAVVVGVAAADDAPAGTLGTVTLE